mmetsp:Transcript_77579/g.169834  ORF Transcript_77579/g.169834 Transcript_77579/m.169834 type:complete len:275 (+) Transcript_77579:163-987(+)
MESYQTVAGGKLASPSIQELPKLHQELGLWMAHTRYQAQPMDQMQIWRMQNTSVTFSTAAGIMSFFFFKRFNPAAKFPLDLIPPFFMFYFTHRAAQAAQLPGLYESFLVLSTPMGFKAREILQAMRENGRLPSHEFGTQLPFQQQRQQMQQQQQQQFGQGSQMPPAPAAVPFPNGNSGEPKEGDFGYGSTAPVPEDPGQQPYDQGFGMPPKDSLGTSVADPWSETTRGTDKTGGSGGEDGWGFGPAEGEGNVPRRRTWDEIRAEQAKRQGARPE